MQALTGALPYNIGSIDISRVSGEIFDDIRFIRLSHWQECNRSTILLGSISCAGQIFRRFELKNDHRVILEFWFRGMPMSLDGAHRFRDMLANLGDLEVTALDCVREVWSGSVGNAMLGEGQNSPAAADKSHVIEVAEVGELNGRRVLALWWSDCVFNRRFLSIYMDANGDGEIVHEIHFSAPSQDMPRHATAIVETLRSFQWRRECPPPMISSSCD